LAKFVGKNIGNSARQQTDYVLALATLGDVTKNRNDPISVVHPKVAKAGTVTCRCRWHYRAKLCQWKHCLTLRQNQGDIQTGDIS